MKCHEQQIDKQMAGLASSGYAHNYSALAPIDHGKEGDACKNDQMSGWNGDQEFHSSVGG